MPSTLVWNSAGPPRMSLLAMVAPPAAGAEAAGAEADAAVVAAGAGVDAAGVASVAFFELHALMPSASAALAAPMIITLRFMILLLGVSRWSSHQRSVCAPSSDDCDLRLDDVGSCCATDGDGLVGEAA